MNHSLLTDCIAKQRILMVKGDLHPSDLAQAYLNRILEKGHEVQALLPLDAEDFMQQAKALDALPSEERADHILFGICLCVGAQLSEIKDASLTIASDKAHTVNDTNEVKALKEDGALILKRPNDDGLGKAVADGFVSAAVLSDFMGSGRVQAARNGAVAIKPSQGRYQCLPSQSTPPSELLLCQPCPIARSVAGIDLLLRGNIARKREGRGKLGLHSLRGSRLAWIPELAGVQLPSDQLQQLDSVIQTLGQLGAEVTEIALDQITENLFNHFGTLIACDAYAVSQNLLKSSLYPVKDTSRWVELGDQATGAQYATALTYRFWMQRYLQDLFLSHDFLITPAILPPTDKDEQASNQESHFKNLLRDSTFLIPFNLGGQPAIVLPCRRLANGLPVSMQIVGRRGNDLGLVDAAYDFEQRSGF